MTITIVVIVLDRCDLNEPERVEELQGPLLDLLRKYSRLNHEHDPNVFPKTLLKLTSLRSLSLQSKLILFYILFIFVVVLLFIYVSSFSWLCSFSFHLQLFIYPLL